MHASLRRTRRRRCARRVVRSGGGRRSAGDTVTADIYQQFATDDFDDTEQVVGLGVELLATTFNPSVLFSLDLHDSDFSLAYESTLAGSFNEGLTELVISDLDFDPMASVTGVVLTDRPGPTKPAPTSHSDPTRSP